MPTKTFENLSIEKQKRILNAAVDEFASANYEHAKLSHIIKQANIPRGSFYQYFNDKFDLYSHLIDEIGQKKMLYMSDTLKNPTQIPFLKLFRELYVVGMKFAYDNPKYVKIMEHLLVNKGKIFDLVMKNNYALAIDLYKSLINKDKELGLIREDLDSEVFAKLVFDMTTNISVDSISEEGTLDLKSIYARVDQIFTIFEKGIQKGE